ncbi:glycosyltransferase [Nonomuraea phyllanthi]|uniref:glycosyltransferase family 4 protein n=1 Tax=Nonomuraea phyllanthi TaxID=2219224 RepID=UPI00129373F6|nr:glycosyltransferase family 4 protein [Nonomuraea phyllanthi]QFY10345.1 glycosyltransferase [Nonomuraea phyllanthi]
MKVAVFSLGPVFPRHVHGGSQRTLISVVRHLADQGHDCDIYCTLRDDNARSFELAPGARVHPSLRFKQTFPEPYYTAPYHLASIAETLRTAASDSDIFYIHDSELVFSQIYDDVPMVSGVQDFVYPTTLEGVFSFRGRQFIAISEYVRQCMSATLSRLSDKHSASVQVVPNGFDLSVFRPVDSSRMASELGIRPDWVPILFPHRPDPRKGLFQAISVIAAAREHLPPEIFARLRLLVPRWMDSELVGEESGHEYQTLYREAEKYAIENDLGRLLHVHPWISADRMPEYFSLGRLTLCIGNFVEAFGNVSVESQLCGTPTIVSRVGAQRTVLPDELVAKVDYGDISGCAGLLAAQLLDEKPFDTQRFREFVDATYSERATVAGYHEVFAGSAAGRRTGTPLTHGGSGYGIPPWCALTAHGYYSDYLHAYAEDRELLSLLAATPDGNLSAEQGIAPDKLTRWEAEGLLMRQRPPGDHPSR